METSRSQAFRKTAKIYAEEYFNLNDDMSAGKYFESVISGFMLAYVHEYNKNLDEDEIPVKAEYDKAEDFINGTDSKITDESQAMLFDMNVLRIDTTSNIGAKKEMPIMTKPGSLLNIELPGTDFEIRYGIRIGNNDHAFSEPVVVMGMCPKNGYEDCKITKSQTEEAMDAFWNKKNPEQLVSQMIDNASRMQNIIHDISIGEENKDMSGLMINGRYIEHEARRQSVTGLKRKCGCFMTKNGKLVTDIHTNEPKWYKTSELWMSNAAHNVMAAAKEIALLQSADDRTVAVINNLVNERTRGDIDPPMVQISSQIVRYYEEKAVQEKIEQDFADIVYSMTGSNGPVL